MRKNKIDPRILDHLEWLGFVKPVGLVVSAPALVRAGAILNRRDTDGQCALRELIEQKMLETKSGGEDVALDFEPLAREVLGWSFSPKGFAGTADSPVPEDLSTQLSEGGPALVPDFAVRELEPKEGASPWQLLVQVLEPGTEFDKVIESKNHFELSPQGRMERLLRKTGVSAGLLFNGKSLRVISAPRGESSGWLDFQVSDMASTAGRPICAAMRMLLSQERLLSLPKTKRLPALLEDSRKFQNEVSERLAEQVLEGLYEFLRGFQAAHDASKGELLKEVLEGDPDVVYRALLTVILRMVFLLYAEERDMLPQDETFLRYYSIAGLHERLREDAALYPDTMDQRFGAWAQLVVLFRMVYDGAEYPGGKLPKRHGDLFDPERFPFLEGRKEPRKPGERFEVPLVPDGTIYRVLEKLLVLDGERLSYRALDVEQIGSVYETMMGFRVDTATGRSVAIRAEKKHGAPTTINLEELLAESGAKREKWLQDNAGRKLSDSVKKSVKEATSLDGLVAALEKVIDKRATPDVVPAGSLILQPSEARRKSGSHYTPRSLTEPIVQKTLEPIFARLARESGVGSRESEDANGRDQIVSGPQGLATGHGSGREGVSDHEAVSEGGARWIDQPDSTSGIIDSSEPGRGSRSGIDQGILSVHSDGKSESERAGDTPNSQQPSGTAQAGGTDGDSGTNRGSGQNADEIASNASRQNLELHSPHPTPNPLHPTPQQILDLKVCDPAMGSGAFLVEACRQLAEALIEAWRVHGGRPEIPADEDEIIYARRLIAQRCLYGVDKNPMAVDLAKVSLWLVTLAKDHAFTFLDHSLRYGDSLVGLDREHLYRFHWDKKAPPIYAMRSLPQKLEHVRKLRAEIAEAGDDASHDELEAKFERSKAILGTIRFLGDAIVSAYFAGSDSKKRLQARSELLARYGPVLEKDEDPRLPTAHPPLPTFHWDFEFPEVFLRTNGGFDAIVGNPPFAGKNSIIDSNPSGYLPWLQETHPESHGNADLVAHFFRRAFTVLRMDGTLGLIATNTIGQGDTRSTGLRWICLHNGTIYAARRRVKWPGLAAVVVSVVNIVKGNIHTPLPSPHLDGKSVERISAFLFHRGGDGDPAQLASNRRRSFQGFNVLGMGFTFDDTDTKGLASPISEMNRLISTNPRNAEVIFPYIGGEEVNTSPIHLHHRFVINFGERGEQECRQLWPELIGLVEQRVRPARLAQDREARARYWWRYGETAPSLVTAITGLNRLLVIALTTTFIQFSFQPNGRVYSHALIVIPFQTYAAFTALQARPHELWARFFGSSMKDDLRYTPSDCFETFPFPKGWEADPHFEAVGQAYYEFRAALMIRNNEGLTKTYNRFHDPEERDPDILRLRELHAEMDRAVLDAYGWTDIPTDCEFILDYEDHDEEEGGGKRKKKKPWRYRWPDEVRDEVLARLLELNKERYEEEVRLGLHAKGKAKVGRMKRDAQFGGPTLINLEDEDA